MKNIINYYYNMIVNDFTKRDNCFIFYINKKKYEFIQFNGDINVVNKIYSILNSYNKIFDEIVLNKEKNILTYYENTPYILLKKNNYSNDEIKLIDIIKYDNLIDIKEELKWKRLWIEKFDYYELLLDQIEPKFAILKESFCYYAGLNEVAINLLNYVDYNKIKFNIAHKRIDKETDLYNPLNIIIDSRVRDIAEYIKNNFFYKNIDVDKCIEEIIKNIIDRDEALLLISRLIYPSYYFDLYDDIYNRRKNESDLQKIIKKNAVYEAFLKKIYNKIKYIYNLPQVEFLEY